MSRFLVSKPLLKFVAASGARMAAALRPVLAMLCLALAGCGLLTGAALAVSSPEIALSKRAEVVLMADRLEAAPGDTITFALAQYLSPGWHSYWRNPGDSGMETTIGWSGLAGDPAPLEFGPIEWPTPHRLPVPPLMNYGFKDEAVLVTVATVPEDWPVGDPIEIEAQADWLVCEEICVPESQLFTLSIPTGPKSIVDEEAARTVADARSRQPAPFSGKALFEEADGRARLFLASPELAKAAQGHDAAFFAADWGVDVPASDQHVERRTDGLVLSFERGEAAVEGPLKGVVTFADEGADAAPLAFEVAALSGAVPPAGSAAAGAGAPGAADGAAGVGSAVLDLGLGLAAHPLSAAILAFLGGAILNLMPCVFPMLALKALSLSKGADAPARVRLGHGVAYTAGVMALFLGFAGALIGFKEAGVAVGWGFQLQSPVVVAVLTLGVFAIGLNLSGVFEIGGVSLSMQGGGERHGWSESFLTGALAAIVASPCTAPFMGAALGYALTQSAVVTVAIFTALALGFAAPIVLLSVAPGVARRLPRPGPWMEKFRQALAFPMYLTAAWLAWVFGAQAGPDALLALMAGAVLLALGAWAFGMARPAAGTRRAFAGLVGALALVGAVALPLSWTDDGASQPRDSASGGESAGAVLSEPLTEARLADLQAAGRTVFVNVTADWCISCKVNERLVLSGSGFADVLERTDAVYLKGDWTRRDETLGAYLKKFGRVGVPLYVVYRPGAEPEILPQILTDGVVRAALGAG